MKYVGILITILLIIVGCNRKPHYYVNVCDNPSLGCKVDTLTINLPLGTMAQCPTPTTVNFNAIQLSKNKIKLGDSVDIYSILLSPINCIDNQVKIIRKSHLKHNEFSVLLNVDTCGNGCHSDSLHTVPLYWNWKPMEIGEYNLEFVNIYGEDIKKKLVVE